MNKLKSKPKVLLVGGPDVDARLELMHYLKKDFNIGAVGSLPSLATEFKKDGFEYNAYHLSRQVSPLADLKTVFELVGIFKRFKPHIVHTFDTKPGVWGRLAARIAGVPVIIGTLPGLGSLYSNRSLMTWIIRQIYQKLQKISCQISDLTIFQNYSDAQQFISDKVVPRLKTKVILGSGISTERFAFSNISKYEIARFREELNLQRDTVLITMISRIIRSKGVLDFVSAARFVRKKVSNVHFLLIGSEDLESVSRLNLQEMNYLKNNVSWSGHRKDIPIVLAASDIFVLPSTGEGIPRVLLEAASMRLPIITTNSPGCNEVVKNGVNGFLVENNSPVDIAEKIIKLIENPRLRQLFGENSRKRMLKNFDISIIVEQTQKYYRQLLLQKEIGPGAF